MTSGDDSMKIHPGAEFGRLTVTHIGLFLSGSKACLCQCSCGSPPKRINNSALLSGATRSCGCLKKRSKNEPKTETQTR